MQPVCFAPKGHPDGVHDDFDHYPFASSSNIWIGYLDEPEKAYHHFISLDDLLDRAQENYENGYKNKFPLYATTFDGRDGRYVPLDEDLNFSAQCSACKDKKKLRSCVDAVSSYQSLELRS